MADVTKITETIQNILTELTGSSKSNVILDEKTVKIVKKFSYEIACALIKNEIGDVALYKKGEEIKNKALLNLAKAFISETHYYPQDNIYCYILAGQFLEQATREVNK